MYRYQIVCCVDNRSIIVVVLVGNDLLMVTNVHQW